MRLSSLNIIFVYIINKMKPKPGHQIKIIVFKDDDTIVCEYTAKTAEELSEVAGISKSRIYQWYRRGKRCKLRVCGLSFEIIEVVPEGSTPQKSYI
jgi:hypothetical protein